MTDCDRNTNISAMHAAFDNGCTADTPAFYRPETSISISKQTTRSIALSQTSILSGFLCEALNQKRLSFVIKYEICKLFVQLCLALRTVRW